MQVSENDNTSSLQAQYDYSKCPKKRSKTWEDVGKVGQRASQSSNITQFLNLPTSTPRTRKHSWSFSLLSFGTEFLLKVSKFIIQLTVILTVKIQNHKNRESRIQHVWFCLNSILLQPAAYDVLFLQFPLHQALCILQLALPCLIRKYPKLAK